jgi:hypothetical protein
VKYGEENRYEMKNKSMFFFCRQTIAVSDGNNKSALTKNNNNRFWKNNPFSPFSRSL